MATKADLLKRVEQLERENRQLVEQHYRMQRELSGTLRPEELPPADMPTALKALAVKHKLPWECFWCYEHERWLDELCSSFPHDAYGTCPECRGEDANE
jgi:hypothetical protein